MPANDSTLGMATNAEIVAFVAAASSSGRTSMVANVAWLLASAGQRVLVVDWGTESPTLHSYLQRFVVDDDLPVDQLGEPLVAALEISVEPPAEHGRSGRAAPRFTPRLRRYALPGRPGSIDVVGCRTGSVPAVRLSGAETGELRAGLRSSAYDYVLMDLPTADPNPAEITRVCDVAVVSFLARPDTVGDAEALARELHDAAVGRVRIIAVPSVFDIGPSPEARRDRNLVRRTFKDLLSTSPAHAQPIELVEIPYVPQHFAYETLAVLVDEPGQPGTLGEAYQRITETIATEALAESEPISTRVRARYRVALGLSEAEPPDTIWLAYPPQERIWADWIANQLRVPGIRVRRLPGRGSDGLGDTVVAILSDNFAGSRTAERLRSIMDSRAPGDETHLVGVQVAGEPVSGVPAEVTIVDLSGLDGADAHRRLHSALMVFEGQDQAGATMPLPGVALPAKVAKRGLPEGKDRRYEKSTIPTASPRIVGRTTHIEAIRDILCPLDGTIPADDRHLLSIKGPHGVGKSELVRAYANQFAGVYDLVWWIPAGDRQSVRTRLTELADHLLVDRSDEAAESALAALKRQPPGTRWLLVYDNATAEAIKGLMPTAGPGDVIVTAVEELAGVGGDVISIGGLDPAASNMLLRNRIIGLSELPNEHALRIGAELGQLPVALLLAAAWLRESAARHRRRVPASQAAVEAAEELLGDLRRPVERAGAAPADPVRRMLDLTIKTLQGTELGRVTVALARMCVFLAPDGVLLRVLRAQTTWTELAAAAGSAGALLLRDEGELDRVLWTGMRFGLFAVDMANPATLRIHRVVQDSLRATTDPVTLRAAQAHLLSGLAGYAPTDAEADTRHNEDLTELQKHLEACGAVDFAFDTAEDILGPAGRPGTRGWAVRRWIVSQIRYLFRLGGIETWRSAIAIADRVDASWLAAFGATDELRGRLAAQRANIRRKLRDHRQAMEIDMSLLAIQRRDLGKGHPRTLMTARGLGGDLRALGRFDEALAEDEATWQGFRESFGDDHPETLMVAFSLANSRRLMGRTREAVELEEASYYRRARVLGEYHKWTIESRRALGAYLGEVGRYPEAIRHLEDNADNIRKYHQKHEHSEEFRTERVLLTLERRTGRKSPEHARETGAALRDRFSKRFGEDAQYTQECRLSYAVDLHVDRKSLAAVDVATGCLDGYAERYGRSHPFTSVCRANLAVFYRGAGKTDQALEFGEQALTDLRDELDDVHPWALATAVNLAGALVQANELAAATSLLIETSTACQEFLGYEHPSTIIAVHNLAIVRGLGQDELPGHDVDWREIDIELN